MVFELFAKTRHSAEKCRKIQLFVRRTFVDLWVLWRTVLTPWVQIIWFRIDRTNGIDLFTKTQHSAGKLSKMKISYPKDFCWLVGALKNRFNTRVHINWFRINRTNGIWLICKNATFVSYIFGWVWLHALKVAFLAPAAINAWCLKPITEKAGWSCSFWNRF